ncbi:MAG: hypothetical protein ABIQ08_13600 [Duganella sp.]
MLRYPPDQREQGPGSVSREISDGVARKRRRQNGGACAYVKKLVCAVARELLCSFFFVSVLFVVKSDAKRMTAIGILFTTETALFVPWEMASRTIESSD